ncbi:DUF58 domain-containing protein [Pseudomonas sp. HR96]|uniref:DUF58 domain-containing protein n=1 Tax=Pseudomonas sp. HR96 TaxID=1027966 RepID=UPI002A75B4EE|nr:DUF58 domain-containing protein [Pseudomonas sp. HR96]WPO99130.1 DUF58 domain-containing protein [Pseudomonas sp. HR96]
MKPTRLLLGWVAALLALSILLGALRALEFAVPGSASAVVWGLLLATLVVSVIDALGLLRKPAVRVRRQLPGSLLLGRWAEVQLWVEHDQGWPLALSLHDHPPAGLDTRQLPVDCLLPPATATSLSYGVRATQRGTLQFARCEVQLASRLGLWRLRRYLECADTLRVYPDFRRLTGGGLLAPEQWLGQLGISQRPRRGQGLEFHQLREFREGDSLRQIDWKATARQRTPIAREYQDERDQQIIFMLDCGRRMRSQDGELGHFEHALNACLLLSQVALRQGDAVGLLTFAGDRPLYLAPRKGQGQLNRLLNSVHDLQAGHRPADFAAASDALLARQSRRALVIWISNLGDEEPDDLLRALKRLTRQHRVLVASLREELLDQLRLTPVSDFQQALSYCGAVGYLNDREQLHERLSAHGMAVLDARPAQLGAQLISRYLGWKKAGTL